MRRGNSSIRRNRSIDVSHPQHSSSPRPCNPSSSSTSTERHSRRISVLLTTKRNHRTISPPESCLLLAQSTKKTLHAPASIRRIPTHPRGQQPKPRLRLLIQLPPVELVRRSLHLLGRHQAIPALVPPVKTWPQFVVVTVYVRDFADLDLSFAVGMQAGCGVLGGHAGRYVWGKAGDQLCTGSRMM
ncbi:hypothetical protein DENSPDRAFT_681301 [Dentipellis sp. KUC8613]|nr:hypothetical protein DENSPDRAFT_681301 [Dentipellis sp. KUC8613]